MVRRKTRSFDWTLGIAILLSVALSLAVPFDQQRAQVISAGTIIEQSAATQDTEVVADALDEPSPVTLVAAAKPEAAAKTLPPPKTRTAAMPQAVKASAGALAVAWDVAQDLLPRGGSAKVTDLWTGLSFSVVRRGGWAHADVEPASSQDTSTMKKVWGTWNWSRRPVVVEVSNKRIAASIAGMPHGGEVVTHNGVSGHFCLHFLNSTTHGSVYTKTGKATVDKAHQAAIQKAVGK